MGGIWNRNIPGIIKVAFADGFDPKQLEQSFFKEISQSKEIFLHVKKGEIFVRQGFPADRMHILLRGAARATVLSQDGECAVLDVLNAPTFFGITEIILEQALYGASVQADSECVLACMPASEYLSMIHEDNGAAFATVRHLAWLAKRNMDKSKLKAIACPKNILIYFLCQSSEGKTLPYTVTLTRKQLSEELHINLRTLYRYLEQLESEGMIKLYHGKIVISKKARSLMEEFCDTQE
ncbi:MAG: Crp/Fnr family transcriptional regulator [Clostridiales bacterium]|jgi:CRP-like cAMP-binding protein|nr:Crp/Fnr family transcriptional regulator [Clostridiales bacterium]